MDQIIHRRSLRSVFADAPLTALDPIPAVMITGITSDSRRVRKGYAFLAIKGESSDGYAYIPSAAANGARVILGNRPKPEDLALPYVQIQDDPRYALAYLSASFQRFPARKLRMIGVTGTDESAVVPSPSWPVELLPQHFMAARPTLAQLWLPPAATADALEMPDTGTGEA